MGGRLRVSAPCGDCAGGGPLGGIAPSTPEIGLDRRGHAIGHLPSLEPPARQALDGRQAGRSSGAQKESAAPLAPAQPVRPTRWT